MNRNFNVAVIEENINEEIDRAKETLNELYIQMMVKFIIENDLIKSSPLDICKKYLNLKEFNEKQKKYKWCKKIIEEQNKMIDGILIYAEESLKRIFDIINEDLTNEIIADL